MSRTETEFGAPVSSASAGWGELWRKEDWWAIWLGLGLVLVGYLLFVNGSSLRWIAVTPAKWANGAQLLAHFRDNIVRYVAQFLLWLVTFAIALTALGHRARFRARLCLSLPRLGRDLRHRSVGPGQRL
jgi:hypothetical protein